jgi:hypothetical protein
MNEQEKLNRYRALMEEARFRIDVLNVTAQNQANFELRFVREQCYLQFRFLCEIIAIGCLIAHGGITKRLLDAYRPDEILNQMQELNPHFYPQPIRTTQVGNRTNFQGISHINHLSRNDLAKLWGKAGDVLHISPLRKAMKLQPANVSSLDDVFEWGKKLSGLLNEHLIVLNKGEYLARALVVYMSDARNNGRPSVMLFNWTMPGQNQPTSV